MTWVSVIIVAIILGGYSFWQKICFNLLFVGYSLFDEMRLATIFFAVLMRIILYPLRILNRETEDKARLLEKRLETAKGAFTDSVQVKEMQRQIRKENSWVFNFILFNFLFYLMNALAIGTMFMRPFDEARIDANLFPFINKPAFPINMIGWIPFVGMVDLSQVNNILNLVSAVGAGLVGLMEIIMHNRTSKRDLIQYLVIYPVGAYTITSRVPSGFEFSLAVFELLTIVIIILEKIAFSRKKEV